MKTKKSITALASYDVDHLGIVAGLIDEIGLVEAIDEVLGSHAQEKVSSGVCVKAMILNSLGFVSAPLYLFEEFFVGKATELLLGEGIKPEHLHDDKLGKVLDKLYEADLSGLFVRLALKAAKQFGVKREVLHLDASSFHVHGQYESEEADAEGQAGIHITYGYSREQRPDLKQFMVDLMCSSDADVPLYFRVADGNEADSAVFAKLIEDFKAQFEVNALFVADSALYNQDNLQSLQGLSWLTRVPQRLNQAKQLLTELEDQDFQESSLPGYRIAERQVSYAGMKQRWLIVESEAASARAKKQQARRLKRQEAELHKQLRALKTQVFYCQADAEQALEAFAARLKEHRLDDRQVTRKKRYLKPGRPNAETPFELDYKVEAKLRRDETACDAALTRSGRFILASNLLEQQPYSNDQLLSEYKAQQAPERGFRFLRDPLFFTSSVFLKTPSRIAALALIMALSLLVYTLGQRRLRQTLAAQEAHIRHQTGKPTQRPTLRWVFQLFQAVHLIVLDGVSYLSNLTPERTRILSFFPLPCRKYYLLI